MEDKITDEIRFRIGYGFFLIGNWLFLRPAEWLFGYDRTTVPGLLRALNLKEGVDEHGIEGLALIKGFYDAYLDPEKESLGAYDNAEPSDN